MTATMTDMDPLLAAFLAGFAASGEGYNGEINVGQDMTADEWFMMSFEYWKESHGREQA